MKKDPIYLFEAFSGIGSQYKALKEALRERERERFKLLDNLNDILMQFLPMNPFIII